jgi:hypothetical protein
MYLGQTSTVTTSHERGVPPPSDVRTERRDGATVSRNAVIRDVPAHHRVEASPPFRMGW